MALSAKNILVGAARIFISYGAGNNRPSSVSSAVFPWKVDNGTNTENSATGTKASVASLLLASPGNAYWREFGFTSNGVELSYEPGYSDVVVDQLLDAARLFQQSLKIMIKTELNEGTFENMNIVWGQQEQVPNASATAFIPALQKSSNDTGTINPNSAKFDSTTASSGSVAVTQLNMNVGALGAGPIERSLVFIGQAAGQTGLSTTYPNTGSVTSASYGEVSAVARKERIYYARRAVQTESTAQSLKRDSATVFPVSFRLLPDVDRTEATGSEYGFIIDRVYGQQ